jgi:RecB family exonuclease
MPIHTDLHTEALLAQYRAQRTKTRESQGAPDTPKTQATQQTKDRVEISISANLTVETANGIMFDSVVEQINKALQEAGIDLKVEDGQSGKVDTSPEGTARRIVDFATGFLDKYRQNHLGEDHGVQIQGFMSLTRNAIEEGFLQARDFLKGITKLSDAIEKDIDQTFELTNKYLDEFQNLQLSTPNNDTPPATTVEA